MSEPRSALYVGSVMHRRLSPCVHRFRYSGFWLLLDLDELAQLPARLRLFSFNRRNLFSLQTRDYGDASATPLRAQIERKLAGAGIPFPAGTIHLLTMPRLLGYSFNPLSIYFCTHPDGTPAAIVYEVHNTFGERHSYVIPQINGHETHHSCPKAFYVSPFMEMGLRYDFTVSQPDKSLAISIRAHRGEQLLLIAFLTAKRRPLSDSALLALLLAMPFASFKVTAAIHWEALRLWWKGVRLVARPAVSRPMGKAE